MAGGQSPNSTNIALVAASKAAATSIVVHPEYQYWRLDWKRIRDILAGQRQVKLMRELYLRPTGGMDTDDYETYLDRAVFYNMTSQTLKGMVGQVFRRDPVVHGLPEKFKDTIRNRFAKDGSGYRNFVKTVLTEAIAMGRFAVLVDAPVEPSTGEAASYVVGYPAENILDWTIEDRGGRYQVTRVLLREFKRKLYDGPSQQNPWIGETHPGSPTGEKITNIVQNINQTGGAMTFSRLVRPIGRYIQAYTYQTVYRELILLENDDGSQIYQQNLFNEDPRGSPVASFIPQVRGQTLDFLPIVFFGATSNTADVEKPPLLDIADLNISHYRSYADLEYARVFTANPIYYAPGNDDEGASNYRIGPSTVWEVPIDGTPPGIVEYKGEGLKSIENACATKEDQIAAIGGRMLPGAKRGSQSPDAVTMQSANEQALLLDVIQAAESGMDLVMRFWLMWRDMPLADSMEIETELNRDFLTQSIGARELRAIHMLYVDGVVPVDVLYTYLVKANVVEADMPLETFKALLEDQDSFINQPDVWARQRGYDSRAQELAEQQNKREIALQQQEVDLQEREVEMQEKAPAPKAVAPGIPPAAGPLPARAAGPTPPAPGRRARPLSAPKPDSTKKPAGDS